MHWRLPTEHTASGQFSSDERLKPAPVGSAMAANRPYGVSSAPRTTEPLTHKQDFMPPHGPAPHGCRGSGKFGVTQHAIAQQKRAESVPRAEGGTSVRTVSGGLPGLGKRH